MSISAIALPLLFIGLLLAASVLFVRRQRRLACAALASALLLVVGVLAGHFDVGVGSDGAVITYAPFLKHGVAVVFHDADASRAELVGDVLNCSAGILGAAVGAALVLGMQRVRARRQPRPTAPQHL